MSRVATAAPEEPDDDGRLARLVEVHRRRAHVMNLWYRLVGRHSVTRAWQRDANARLEFDFDRLALCGVGVGAAVERLRDTGLGPADESYGDGVRVLSYLDLGLEIAASEVRGIHTLELHWWRSETLADESFPGRCLFDGRELSLSSQTECEEVREMLGTPSSEETGDEGFTSLEYRVSKGEVSFSFDEEEGGGLSHAVCFAGFILKDF